MAFIGIWAFSLHGKRLAFLGRGVSPFGSARALDVLEEGRSLDSLYHGYAMANEIGPSWLI